MTWVYEIIPKTSTQFFSEHFKDFPKTLTCCRKCSKMSNFWAFFEGKNFSHVVILLGHKVNIKHLFGIFFEKYSKKVNWIELKKLNYIFFCIFNHVLKKHSSRFVSQAWEIVLVSWDQCSCIMHELTGLERVHMHVRKDFGLWNKYWYWQLAVNKNKPKTLYAPAAKRWFLHKNFLSCSMPKKKRLRKS